MKYVSAGTTIINRIIFEDKSVVPDICGGAGFYAYSGLRFSTPDCLLITSAGPDFRDYYGRWFEHNGASMEGVIPHMEKTYYSELYYMEDGKYNEYSIYGEGFVRRNRKKTIVRPSELAPFLGDTAGLYYGGKYFSQDFYDEMVALKKMHPKLKLMLEYSPKRKIGGELDPGADVIGRFDTVDMLSINKHESFALFGVDDEQDAIKILTDFPFPVYYRVGKRGAYMIDGGRVAFVPMISVAPPEREIDPTGCGNSSTAAAMWAWLEGYDLLMTCIWGNVIAAYNALQYGPYFDMSRENFDGAMRRAEKIYAQLT